MVNERQVFEMLRSLRVLLCLVGVGVGGPSLGAGAEPPSDSPKSATGPLELTVRYRQETAPGTGRYHVLHRNETWSPQQTAIVVCDMWDLHHCLNATQRGKELAPRMDAVLKTARAQGVTIIHAPSSCMEFYEDHPARVRARQTPRTEELPEEIGSWCHQIPSETRGAYPIDQSDGGEDDDPEAHAAWARKLADLGRNPKAPWKRQTELLTIRDQDYISDSGEEIWSILEHRGIDNVILLGVHTNMCVLGRPFGLRQMARNGKHVVLMRDMTDTMYNPLRAPYVSHFTGTDLIVAHIEKYVCPTITSDQLLGGTPFRFANDQRPTLVILMAEKEYKTNETLPPFAVQHLGKHFRIEFVYADEEDRNTLPGIEAVRDADVLFVSVRRRTLPPEQLKIIREFVEAGKPLLGIRTASHAFCLRNTSPPAGLAEWPEFDRQVFGGNYTNHYGSGPDVRLTAVASHPILDGIDAASFVSSGSLYRVSPLADSTQVLLEGTIPEHPSEPVAWTNTSPAGARVFYTSLGHPDDFKQPEFNEFLRNAVYWTADVPVRDEVPPGY